MIQVKKFLGSEVLSTLFKILAICSLFAAVGVYYEQRSSVKCVVTYIDQQSTTAKARSDALKRDLDTIDKLFHDLNNLSQATQAKKLEALNNYFKTREENDKLRNSNPLPVKHCT